MSDGYPKPIKPPKMIEDLAKNAGGTIDECALLPDGSGFATMSMPLPKDHWLTAEAPTGFNVPPMPIRMGTEDRVTIAVFPNKGYPDRSMNLSRQEFADLLRTAARYGIRCATMNGKENDFDPDAMVQNFITGMLGYWTADGLSSDTWANP